MAHGRVSIRWPHLRLQRKTRKARALWLREPRPTLTLPYPLHPYPFTPYPLPLLPVYRLTLAVPPFITRSTSASVTMLVSPGVVIASAPCAAPHSTAHCGPLPASKP